MFSKIYGQSKSIFKEAYATHYFWGPTGKEVYEEITTVMKLVFFPNKVLLTKCEHVREDEFDATLHNILDHMKTVMLDNKGVGLSANQIGVNKKVMVVLGDKQTVYEMINPVLLETQGSVSMTEGCLSAPGVFLDIVRPESLVVQYNDRNGEVQKVIAEGLEARTILHEMEHLEGEGFMKHVNRKIRKTILSKLKKRVG